MAGNINCNTALIIGLNITLNEIKFKGAIVSTFAFLFYQIFSSKNMSYLISSGKRYHEFLGLFHNLEFLSVKLIKKTMHEDKYLNICRLIHHNGRDLNILGNFCLEL